MLRKILLVTLFITLVAACAPQAAPTTAPVANATSTPKTLVGSGEPSTLNFTDDLGRQLTFKQLPQRIVSLAASNTEILFAIGAGEQVVGRDEFSNYPEETKDVTNIGSAYQTLNTELIVSLKPDLVLAAEINT